jgi:NTE family protein
MARLAVGPGGLGDWGRQRAGRWQRPLDVGRSGVQGSSETGAGMEPNLAVPNVALLRRMSGIFSELTPRQLIEIWSQAKIHELPRGHVLVGQGTPSDSMFVVVSGRFEVSVEDGAQVINEVGAGETIGEIGFFSGESRTATVTALRDAIVLELDRGTFDRIARQVPAIHQTVLRALARRLAGIGGRGANRKRVATARTIAVVKGGLSDIPPAFFDRLEAVITQHGKGLLLRRDWLKRFFADRVPDDAEVSNWLNAIETEYELIAYVTDETLTDWTRKAIRQADQVLIVVTGAPTQELNPIESFALQTHPAARRRMVCLHSRRAGAVHGTEVWLRDRDVAMHHHVALEDDLDLKSLHRFLTGKAVGFVASGGGGFGPAHVGIYKAFQEQGVTFDILGGTSVGSAILGGFAALMTPDEIDQGLDDVFVRSRGFKRFTLPRYALLDHVDFDEALRRRYKGILIENAWRPFFAVSTILDGSGQGAHLIRRGPLWKAVRASCSLPAILPPVFGDDGHMLVDGGMVDNIPLRPMKSLKTGPNLVVHFDFVETRRFSVDYMSIPGRWSLIRQLLTPGGRRKLPAIPGPIDVLQRCLLMNQNPALLQLGPHDLVLSVPIMPGASLLDFDRHSQVFEASYQWCRAQIDKFAETGNPALSAILATKS